MTQKDQFIQLLNIILKSEEEDQDILVLTREDLVQRTRELTFEEVGIVDIRVPREKIYKASFIIFTEGTLWKILKSRWPLVEPQKYA